MVSDRLRFIYLSTAKNATSTLFALLSRQRCGGRVLARGDVPGQVWDEYFTFAFLSDPVDRLLRAYQEVSLRMERNELPQRAFAAMPEGMARFVSFLSDLEENGPFNEHVALQEAFVEGRRVDYWGRVETLREDLRRIFRHLGAEGAAPPPHRRQQTTHVIARADLDPRTIARIQELYRADYRLIAAVRPGDLAASPATPVRVSLDLADGTSHSFELPDDHPSLGDLLAHDPAQASASAQGLVQIPLDAGNTALTIAPRHVVRVAFNRPTPQRLEDTQSPPSPPRDHPRTGRLASAKHTHPFTNVDEAHLGGYVRSVSQPRMHLDATPHGDESTWYPRLWQWLVEELGVRSVLDVGCGEGHAAGFFRDAGCEVIGVDGSREARLDSVIPGDHVVHDFIEGPFVPDRSFDLVWSCEFVEHVDERFTHNFLASFAAGKRYLAMTFAPPGTGGWHHVNCRERSYWLDKMQRLGFEPDQALCDRARELAGHGHFSRTGEVFVRSPRRDRRVFVPGGGVPAAAPQSQDPLPIHPMEVARRGKSALYLFHDIFVHPTRATIVAVCPHYGDDWIPAEDGVDHDAVDLILGEQRVRGHCRRHRLDSWEPCMLLEFEAPEVAEAIASGPAVGFDIEVGPHRQHFEISSAPSPSFGVAMSLVVRDENRWIRGFLQYYLECVGADHVFVYDHDTAEREQLLRILEPYRRQGRVTYIPWNYQWRNDTDRKMTAQPAQEAHSLNRFANSRWLGFFDVDEFLRLPHTTLPDFLGRYDDAQVDGLSFGLRWFSYHGPLGFEGVENPLLTYLHKRPDPLGRKRQKLFIKGGSTRFARLHWLEEGKWELPIDDSEIYFHHYEHRPVRFEEAKQKPGEYDDYMLRFHDRLCSGPKAAPPGSPQAWVEHINQAVESAEAGQSQLVEAVLSVDGMCGRYTRHFYNNLCNFAGCRYLEIGSYHGASTCAALYANDVAAVCIDNWSQFRGRRGRFEEQLQRFRGRCAVEVIEGDCFAIDTESLGPFDVFLYDAKHDAESQYRAIEHYAPTLAELAVVVIDDWSRPEVRQGTRAAIRDLGIEVAFEREILPAADQTADNDRQAGKRGWWNGMAVMLVRANNNRGEQTPPPGH